ncbi:prephenate dehydrogenase/arogenate dehydrogenase family protein [Roseiconus nitratireducens]|uniref:Prephenate dehydrogenase/arogenate dehydrogenase family protein n=2 Tax=Roseiconus nitratireducens TaxID=2605748 RepID=A0A5M6D3J5_9BACT|nr:prephenate dehydrogenase/arogenate dehydrogenase family protein [Roseiconus nitratireducens]
MTELPEKPLWLQRAAIVGVGLLGGSVGMSLRRSGVHVVGYARTESGCRSAVQQGAVDEAFCDLATACRQADVVVIASPVDRIASLVDACAATMADDAMITDVGSTKAKIVAGVADLGATVARRFVAAHPIAGSEKTGVANASRTLLDGKAVILTPGHSPDPGFLQRAREFWRQTGGEVIEMTPEEHDRRLAAVSHLPHLMASLLAGSTEPESLPLVGSGWKDMTRVASGDPAMWTAICDHNRDAILDQIDQFRGALDRLRALVAAEETGELRQWLEAAKARKDQAVAARR